MLGGSIQDLASIHGRFAHDASDMAPREPGMSRWLSHYVSIDSAILRLEDRLLPELLINIYAPRSRVSV